MGIIKTYPLWISYSSIKDFLSCPRAYFLHRIYKDPITGNKITTINPSLALGQVVHEVLESLAFIKSEDRFKESLLPKFDNAWGKIAGELGGFKTEEEESVYKKRGQAMIRRVMNYPRPLLNKALRLKSSDPSFPLPRYFLSAEKNIVLCGKVDWLEYIPEDDSVHIIDFKTGMNDEDISSLQMPIYSLLVKNCQKRNISKASYWYLERDSEIAMLTLPDPEEAHGKILAIGIEIKELKKSGRFICPKNGCFTCKPLEAIVNKQAKFVGANDYQDIYIIN